MVKAVTLQYDNLPTAEEYKAAHDKPTPMIEYREPKYRCSKCDGAMCKYSMYAPKILNTTYYQYQCNKCQVIELLDY